MRQFSKFTILLVSASMMAGCAGGGLFKKKPKTPVLGDRVAVLVNEADIEIDQAGRQFVAILAVALELFVRRVLIEAKLDQGRPGFDLAAQRIPAMDDIGRGVTARGVNQGCLQRGVFRSQIIVARRGSGQLIDGEHWEGARGKRRGLRGRV